MLLHGSFCFFRRYIVAFTQRIISKNYFSGDLSLKKYISRTVNTILVAIAVLCVVSFTAFSLYITAYSDYKLEEEELDISKSTITKLYTMDFSDRENRVGMPADEPYEELFANRRIWTPYEQFPDNLINAFVAIEDHRYFDHSGVDLLRTGKAALNYFLHFSDRSFGGSTITQQLVKNITCCFGNR